MRCWRCGRRNPAGAATCSRCHADLAPRSPLSAARKKETQEKQDTSAERAVPASHPIRSSHQRLALIISLALVALLALTGLGAVRAAELLQFAMRSPGAGDVATRICTALQTQDYALLTRLVDPAPVPPSAAGPFDAAALQTQLRALDQSEGVVTRCTPGSFSGDDRSLRYALTLQRAKAPLPSTLIVLLRRQNDGTWQISRATSFSATSA